jgi:MFS family permease
MMRFVPIFVASFFLSVHFGTTLYTNSSLLSKFFPANSVSFLFILGALGNTVLFLFAPKLIERVGKRFLLLSSLVLSIVSTVLLAFVQSWELVALSFISYTSFLSVAPYALDIFLEETSVDTKTGGIRGSYLTTINIGIALGPLLVSYLAREDSLSMVYIAGAILLIPTILLSIFSLSSKNDFKHKIHHLLLPFKLWWKTKAVRRTTLARLTLDTFFAFMIIYMPLYLNGVLGFEWSVIGIMFTIMLLPFVIFQWPVGEFADRFIGEKEFMIIGFLIIGMSLLLMPYLEATVLIWTLVLFLSRVGASFVEVTTESYFFKHVDASETGLLSIHRLTRPFSVVLASSVAIFALNLVSFEKIFFILAIIIFFGLKQALKLRDTL